MTISEQGNQILLNALKQASTHCIGLTDTGKTVPGVTVRQSSGPQISLCFSYDELNRAGIKQSKDSIVKVLVGAQDISASNYYASFQVQPTKRIRGAGLMIKIELEKA